jgi:hypothetical protein
MLNSLPNPAHKPSLQLWLIGTNLACCQFCSELHTYLAASQQMAHKSSSIFMIMLERSAESVSVITIETRLHL